MTTHSVIIIILVTTCAALFVVGILITASAKIQRLEEAIRRDRQAIDDAREQARIHLGQYNDTVLAEVRAQEQPAIVGASFIPSAPSGQGSYRVLLGSITLRRFPFSDDDSRDYARLQAEELRDMLNDTLAPAAS